MKKQKANKARDKPIEKDRIKVFRLPKIKRSLSERLAKHYWLYRFIKWLILDFIVVCVVIYNFSFNSMVWTTYLWLGLLVIFGVFSIYNFINCLRAYNASSKIKNFKDTLDEDKYACVRYGQPGTGKSFTTTYETGLLADLAWENLAYEFWLGFAHENELKTEDDKYDWEDIKSSFKFYNEGDVIPCLASNIKIKYGDLESFNLYREHLEQQLKLPYRTVCFADEIGSVVSIDEVNSKRPENIAMFCRWLRHFGQFYLYATEQDKTRVNKDIRRVVAENRLILSNNRILVPKFWKWLYKKLKKFFSRNVITYISSKRYAKFMKGFEHFLDCVGYRKIKYKNYASTETGGVVVDNGIKKQFFPAVHDYKYDTHEYRRLYLCRNQALIKLKGKVGNVLDKSLIKEALSLSKSASENFA